jgi:putative hydrolase of the HAD superfamily
MDSELYYTGPLVIFDLDDTLYKELDFLKSGFKAVAEIAAPLVGRTPAQTFAFMLDKRKCGDNVFDALATLADTPDKEDFVRKAVETYRFHKPDISLSQGAREMLETLSGLGVRLGIVTDGRSLSQRNKLKALDIEKYFPPCNIFISEETGVDKRSFKPWQSLVHRYPNARRFVYVGDNPAKDFRMPNILGWNTIGLRDTAGVNIHSQEAACSDTDKPQLWVDSLSELTDYLTSI